MANSHSMIVAEAVKDSSVVDELVSVLTATLVLFDVAEEELPLALTDEKIPALALELAP